MIDRIKLINNILKYSNEYTREYLGHLSDIDLLSLEARIMRNHCKDKIFRMI